MTAGIWKTAPVPLMSATDFHMSVNPPKFAATALLVYPGIIINTLVRLAKPVGTKTLC